MQYSSGEARAVAGRMGSPIPRLRLSKQVEQEQNHGNGDHLEGYQLGVGREKNGGKCTGSKKHNW